jgi:hypothetical protein
MKTYIVYISYRENHNNWDETYIVIANSEEECFDILKEDGVNLTGDCDYTREVFPGKAIKIHDSWDGFCQ